MSSPPSPGTPRLAPHLDPWITELAGAERGPRRGRGGRAKKTDEAVAALLASPIPTPRRLAVIGLKGGTGKTTLAVAMGMTYARVRGENVLLFDADTRHGSLPLRTGVLPVASAHDIAVTGDPGRVEILAGSLGRSPDGVWVLPSGRSAAQSAEMDERVYTGAMNAVYRHFPITITDCGAGVATPLMQRVLSGCHCLVLATTANADGVLTTESAVDWLQRTGYGELVKRSIVVLTNVTPKGPGLSLEDARRRFASSCSSVFAIPADRHLALGSTLDLDKLAPPTRAAVTRLAAAALGAALAA
ncbi:MAG: MinD/ParA family protein [Geodermatophilaceae bacterium]|nr:MinD/ParA family protein [Geodermatophilaceae bacterium]